MDGDTSLKLTDDELKSSFADPATAARFPIVLNIKQAADLLGVPVGTVRDWRSRGLLPGCGRRVGREVKFYRDRLIKRIFNEGLNTRHK